MKAVWLLALSAGLGGCLGVKLGSDGSGAGTSASGAGGSTTAVQGAGCFPTENGATLCRALSLCPMLVVDEAAFPDCGFRVLGQAIDLECSCTGELCPIGVATTCPDAAALLARQNQGIVCNQVSEGRCVPGMAAAASSSAGAGSSCDGDCRARCVDDPTCLQACGC